MEGSLNDLFGVYPRSGVRGVCAGEEGLGYVIAFRRHCAC